MSSTLLVRKTPKPQVTKEVHFKQPVKGVLARRYYDHDGSLGGGLVTVGPEDVAFFEGLVAAGVGEKDDMRDLKWITSLLQAGESVDMWFEV